MINAITDAVIRQVRGLFGDGCQIYVGGETQVPETPCFLVQMSKLSRKPVMGRRTYQEAEFCIRYIPAEGAAEKGREINRVAGILLDGMEYVTLEDGSLLRGTGMRAEPDTGLPLALSFLVSYNMFIMKTKEEEEAMEHVKVN